jgi:hypothetical protein
MARYVNWGITKCWENKSEKSIAIDYLNSEFQGTQEGFILSQTPVGALFESI